MALPVKNRFYILKYHKDLFQNIKRILSLLAIQKPPLDSLIWKMSKWRPRMVTWFVLYYMDGLSIDLGSEHSCWSSGCAILKDPKGQWDAAVERALALASGGSWVQIWPQKITTWASHLTPVVSKKIDSTSKLRAFRSTFHKFPYSSVVIWLCGLTYWFGSKSMVVYKVETEQILVVCVKMQEG